MTSVAIVLDRDYGPRLRPLLEEHRLWVVHSAINRQAVEQLWQERTDAMDVTIEEREPPSTSFGEYFENLLENVLVHFDDLEIVEVVGAAPEQLDEIDESMMAAGLARDVVLPYKLRYLK